MPWLKSDKNELIKKLMEYKEWLYKAKDVAIDKPDFFKTVEKELNEINKKIVEMLHKTKGFEGDKTFGKNKKQSLYEYLSDYWEFSRGNVWWLSNYFKGGLERIGEFEAKCRECEVESKKFKKAEDEHKELLRKREDLLALQEKLLEDVQSTMPRGNKYNTGDLTRQWAMKQRIEHSKVGDELARIRKSLNGFFSEKLVLEGMVKKRDALKDDFARYKREFLRACEESSRAVDDFISIIRSVKENG